MEQSQTSGAEVSGRSEAEARAREAEEAQSHASLVEEHLIRQLTIPASPSFPGPLQRVLAL